MSKRTNGAIISPTHTAIERAPCGVWRVVCYCFADLLAANLVISSRLVGHGERSINSVLLLSNRLTQIPNFECRTRNAVDSRVSALLHFVVPIQMFAVT